MKIDFKKGDGLVPVVIQDYASLQVLMLGYMNEEAYKKTRKDKIVTFFSRSKKPVVDQRGDIRKLFKCC